MILSQSNNSMFGDEMFEEMDKVLKSNYSHVKDITKAASIEVKDADTALSRLTGSLVSCAAKLDELGHPSRVKADAVLHFIGKELFLKSTASEWEADPHFQKDIDSLQGDDRGMDLSDEGMMEEGTSIFKVPSEDNNEKISNFKDYFLLEAERLSSLKSVMAELYKDDSMAQFQKEIYFLSEELSPAYKKLDDRVTKIKEILLELGVDEEDIFQMRVAAAKPSEYTGKLWDLISAGAENLSKSEVVVIEYGKVGEELLSSINATLFEW